MEESKVRIVEEVGTEGIMVQTKEQWVTEILGYLSNSNNLSATREWRERWCVL